MKNLFILDPTSKKYNCPQCNRKSFVKYVHEETKKYELPHSFGRCDRENSCGYFKKVSKEIVIDYKKDNNIKPSISYVIENEIPMNKKPIYIEPDIFKSSLSDYENNELVKYLYNKYGTKNVEPVINSYNVGTSKKYNGGVVFWQVCKEGLVRGGPIIAYDHKTGKRLKTNWAVSSVHSELNLDTSGYSRCLFGEHLLAYNPERIGIVESEKTAIIKSIEIPSVTWLATSSKHNFKYELLSSLKPLSQKAKIIAYPDKGGYEKWNNVANEIRGDIQITVSDILEKDKYEDGCDIADVI